MRRPIRRAVRRNVRRDIRRTRRRFLRRRRLMRGSFAILFFGAAAYKLRQSDVERIETETKRPAEDLTEDELRAAMQRLGIQKLELDDEDESAIDAADDE